MGLVTLAFPGTIAALCSRLFSWEGRWTQTQAFTARGWLPHTPTSAHTVLLPKILPSSSLPGGDLLQEASEELGLQVGFHAAFASVLVLFPI